MGRGKCYVKHMGYRQKHMGYRQRMDLPNPELFLAASLRGEFVGREMLLKKHFK